MPEAATVGGTVLAFDFGLKRIGVAVGEPALKQAHALATIHGEANAARFGAIARLIEEWQPSRLVVGLSLSLEGEANEMTARCRRFANQLHGRFGLPVDFADERLSSVDAEDRLRQAGRSAREARPQLDAVAAQIILEGYFDAR